MQQRLPNSFNFANNLTHKPCTNPTPGTATCVDCVQQMYFNGNIVNYQCQNKRDIYVGKYLCVHAREICESLLFAHGNSYFQNLPDSISTLVIGSGPGTDIIGIDLFIGSLQINKKFDIHQIDLIDWSQQQSIVIKDIVNTNQIVIKPQKVQLDLNSKFDLIIMSYVASELNANGTSFIHGIITGRAKSGAVCIINDRNDLTTKNKINSFISNGCCMVKKNNGHCGFNGIPASNNPKFMCNSTTWVFYI